MTKFAGKPYAGKPHVRIDEGLGEVNSLPGLLYCPLSEGLLGVVKNKSASRLQLDQLMLYGV